MGLGAGLLEFINTIVPLALQVGEPVLEKKVGNKRWYFGALQVLFRILDIIARYFTDTVTAIEVHRGF